jgi:hypothetical protein
MAKKKAAKSNAPAPTKKRGHDPARTAANKARRIFKEAQRQQKAAEKRAARAEAQRKEQEALALRTVFIRSMPHEEAVALEIKDLIKRKEAHERTPNTK